MAISKQLINALTIQERLEALKKKYIVGDTSELLEDKWFHIRTIPKGLFYEKLSAMNLSADEFTYALKDFTEGEKRELILYLEKTDWYQNYEKLMSWFYARYQDKKLEINEKQLIYPMKEYIENELSHIKTSHIQITSSVIKKMSTPVEIQLELMTWKCLVIEMNEYKENHVLEGNTSRERFLAYLEKNFGTPAEIDLFYQKYPVLLRLMIVKTFDVIKESIAILKNLDEHYESYKDIFKLESNAIKEISCDLGDTHNHGKAVATVEFADGKKVVYKPRNVESVYKIYEFYDYINETSGLKDLYINKCYGNSDFFLEGFVEYKECKTEEELKNFYIRFGEMIGIISMLHLTDIHCENVIASGDYPVIIDYEPLLTQFKPKNKNHDFQIYDFKYPDIFYAEETALFPIKALNNNIENEGIEVSGLDGGREQKIPKKVLVPIDIYTDNMHYEYQEKNKPGDKNLPILNGKVQNFRRFTNEIRIGFEQMICFIYSKRQEIEKKISELFTNMEVRQILKNTSIYTDVIKFMNHPNYLRDMVNLERMLDGQYLYPHEDKRIVLYEIADMLHSEVPIFYTNTSEVYLKTSTGDLIEGYYHKPIIEVVIENLKKINEDTVNREKEKLRVLLDDYDRLYNERISEYQEVEEDSTKKYSVEQIGQINKELFKKINKASVYNEKQEIARWECITEAEGKKRLVSCNNDLEDGRTGILLYCEYLEKAGIINEPFTAKLEKSIMEVPCSYSDCAYKDVNSSAYVRLMRGDELEQIVKMYLDNMSFIMQKQNVKCFDWVSGIAGCIKIFYKLILAGCRERWLVYKISMLMNELIRFVRNTEMKELDHNSIGLKNGEIGIAYALLIGGSVLNYDASCEVKILTERLGNKLIAYKNGEVAYDGSWETGFAGLGLGAIACKRIMPLDEFDQFIALAKEEISAHDSTNMSLYGGLAGEAEFLIEAGARYENEDELSLVLRRKINRLLDFYKMNHDFILCQGRYIKNCGIGHGIAGIGYVLLRAWYAEKYDSILLLN